MLSAAGGNITPGRSWKAVIPLAAGVDQIVDAPVVVRAAVGAADEVILSAQGQVQTPIAGPVGKVLLTITTAQTFRFAHNAFASGSGVDTTSATVLFKHIKVRTEWKLATVGGSQADGK
jgi:hypothetical protein